MTVLLSGARRMGVRAAFTAAAFLALGASLAQAAPASDDWITTRTKIALWTAGHVESTAVHVDTAGGRVTLYGKVHDQQQKDVAESVARGIPSVTTVRNLLEIVPESGEKQVAIADDKIQEQAQKALKDDATLSASSMTVKSVNKGTVLLAGKARGLFDYLRALEVVNDVPGVRRVDSEVNAPDEDARFVRTTAAGAKDAALDDWITTATKMRLLADSHVPALEVSVDTRRGVVTLFGIVPTALAKEAANADARKVEGMVSVNNQLQIVAAASKADVDVKDDVILGDLKAAFKNDEAFKHVSVKVKNGVARLTGHVTSSGQRLNAAILARGSRGVRSVDDDLHVQRS
jgi:hyperosmotically inducible protein